MSIGDSVGVKAVQEIDPQLEAVINHFFVQLDAFVTKWSTVLSGKRIVISFEDK